MYPCYKFGQQIYLSRFYWHFTDPCSKLHNYTKLAKNREFSIYKKNYSSYRKIKTTEITSGPHFMINSTDLIYAQINFFYKWEKSEKKIAKKNIDFCKHVSQKQLLQKILNSKASKLFHLTF